MVEQRTKTMERGYRKGILISKAPNVVKHAKAKEVPNHLFGTQELLLTTTILRL